MKHQIFLRISRRRERHEAREEEGSGEATLPEAYKNILAPSVLSLASNRSGCTLLEALWAHFAYHLPISMKLAIVKKAVLYQLKIDPVPVSTKNHSCDRNTFHRPNRDVHAIMRFF